MNEGMNENEYIGGIREGLERVAKLQEAERAIEKAEVEAFDLFIIDCEHHANWGAL